MNPRQPAVSLNSTVAGLAVTAAVGLFVSLVGQDPPLDQIYDATHASLFPVSAHHEGAVRSALRPSGSRGSATSNSVCI